MEEGREDVAVGVLGWGGHGGVGGVAFFVGGFGLFPAGLRAYLWGDEGRGAVGEVEAAEFGQYTRALVLFLIDGLTGDQIAEGDIIVGDLEEDGELHTVLVLNVDNGLCGGVVTLRGLRSSHLVTRG